MLATLRNKKGLTQREIARKLGVHVQFVSNWERSKSKIPMKYAKKMASILGTNVDSIYTSMFLFDLNRIYTKYESIL